MKWDKWTGNDGEQGSISGRVLRNDLFIRLCLSKGLNEMKERVMWIIRRKASQIE